jgi:hypothetical protein
MQRLSLWVRSWVGIALCAGVALQVQAAECPSPLRIAFLDKAIPTLLEGDGSDFADPPGRFVEWTRAALRATGCEAVLVRVPQRRLTLDTATDFNQITLNFAYTPERARQLVFPMRRATVPDMRLALSQTHLSLYARADRADRVKWDGTTLRPAGLKVGIVGGGVEEPLARAAGWTLDLALSHSGSLAKLRRGQVDVALLPALSLTLERLAEPPALVELSPKLMDIGFFAPVSPALHASHPQFVQRFWLALCQAARGPDGAKSCGN